MNKIFLTLVMIGINSYSLNASPLVTKDAPILRTSAPAPLAIHIRHTSFGAGIDHEAATAIRDILSNELSNGTLVRYVFKNEGGLEGESDSCVEFKSMEEMNRVRELLNEAVNGKDRVQLATAGDCKNGFWGE